MTTPPSSPSATFPYPDSIDPAGAAGTVAVPHVDGGPDLGARDYRADPSAGQSVSEGRVSVDRDHANILGTAVAPVPDRTIQSYDLPDQLSAYDRTS